MPVTCTSQSIILYASQSLRSGKGKPFHCTALPSARSALSFPQAPAHRRQPRAGLSRSFQLRPPLTLPAVWPTLAFYLRTEQHLSTSVHISFSEITKVALFFSFQNSLMVFSAGCSGVFGLISVHFPFTNLRIPSVSHPGGIWMP